MKWLSYRVMRLAGWRFIGTLPDFPKMILLGAPHTSNWDFVLFLAALQHFRMKVRYMAKEGLFRWPFGYFFKAFGGIPVSRSKPGGVVGQAVKAFQDSEAMLLVIAPEGTRSAVPMWKSGFLHIARDAGVPVVPVSVDGAAKTVAMGPAIFYEGDTARFMGDLRAFYEDKKGLRSEGAGPITVAEER